MTRSRCSLIWLSLAIVWLAFGAAGTVTADEACDAPEALSSGRAAESTRLATHSSRANDLLSSESCCPPLPPPSGNVIEVFPSQARQLDSIVEEATISDTILLNDGLYQLHGDYLWIDTPGLTIRSKSGDREAVIIDGGYETTEIIHVHASNVTIADLTLKRAYYHPIHVSPPLNEEIVATLIYNVHIIDPGEQAIKINQNGGRFADYGEIACSRIELTDEGRTHIRNDCYTGGVDGHQAWGWVVRDNYIEGFWCPYGLSEHGIHFWTGSRDTVVERNVLVDNCRGIGFGLGESGSGRAYSDDPCPDADGHVGHFAGLIRNNFIFQSRQELRSSEYGFDSGISLDQACGTQVLHNTVVATQIPFSSIEWRFANTSAQIINNLVSHNLLPRDVGSAFLEGNVDDAPLSLFVDTGSADLHLAADAGAAIDRGVQLVEGRCDDDIDCDSRPWGGATDVGADEWTDGDRVSKPLESGWNLVSLPIVPTDSAIARVLASIQGNYDLVSSYDACSDRWLSYDPDLPEGATLVVLDETRAFWIRMIEADTLVVSGTRPATTNQDLCEGWNLVAYPTGGTREVTLALDSISSLYTAVYGYQTGTANPWQRHFVAAPSWANELTHLVPGYAYWLHVIESCTLSIDY